MTPGDACFALIKKSETLFLVPYLDPDGFWTWAFGHKRQPGEVMPVYLSYEQAVSILNQDVARIWGEIRGLLGPIPGLTQGMVDALTGFAFNEGSERLKGSTLLRLLEAGDIDGAAAQFSHWDIGNGRKLRGLDTRRAAERSLFLSLTNPAE